MGATVAEDVSEWAGHGEWNAALDVNGKWYRDYSELVPMRYLRRADEKGRLALAVQPYPTTIGGEIVVNAFSL
jgi:hypothetical protein